MVNALNNKLTQYSWPKWCRALMLLPVLLSPYSIAEQIEVTGTAKIVNGNIDKAREDAINQALNYASLRGGVNFSSQQQITQGSLTQDTFSMQRMGAANNIELLSELVSNDIMTVILSLNIDDESETEQCQAQSLKAAIMLPQADIADRTQLSYGHLSDFNKAFTLQFGKAINQQSSASFAKVHADERLDTANDLVNFKGYSIPSWLGEITDSQYILKSYIIDMSTEPYTSSFMGFVDEVPSRQFSYELTLYHGISGEEVWSQTFATTAPWEFERQETVMPNSQRFWSSSYGQAITSQLQLSVMSLDNALKCRPLLGQIIARQGDRVIINLGRKNGVKLGDKFQLVLQKNIPDRLNIMRAVVTKNRTEIVIDQVSEGTATAMIENVDAADNIQVHDIAIKL
jgi:hypothetical protein